MPIIPRMRSSLPFARTGATGGGCRLRMPSLALFANRRTSRTTGCCAGVLVFAVFLCGCTPLTLLGIPPEDLLRRRPDVRKAERQAAAQSAQIGIAEADFYPHLFLNGNFGYSAQSFNRLFRPTAFEGTFGPTFQWSILNYGRILNNVRAQDAQFQ